MARSQMYLKQRISQRLNLTLMKTNTSTEYRRN
jgi:hypothetical protein